MLFRSGYEHAAEYVMEKACRKHVYDMHYEVRIQSVINYHFEKNKVKLVKKDARAKTLTKEEYMQVKYIRGCILLKHVFSMYHDVTN